MASVSGRLARRLNKWIPAALLRPLGGPAALFFHGVEHEIADPRMQEMHHHAEIFGAIAKTLQQNFQVLPLSAIDDVISFPHKHRRSVFLMSDDGYLNTLTTAAEILSALKLPWTLFISTHHIDSGALNPIHLLRLFFHHAPAGVYSVPHFSTPVKVDDTNRSKTAEVWIERLKALDWARASEVIAALLANFSPYELDGFRKRYASERFLTWEQVRTLKDQGVEIGGHAHWHWPMNAHQPLEDLRIQAGVSRRRILEKLGECRFFAYPFGTPADIAKAAWPIVRDAGYSHAFTTVAGTLDASRNPWLLPRYGIGAEEQNIAAMIPLLVGNNRRLRRLQAEMAAP